MKVHTIGVDLGGTKTLVAALDVEDHVLDVVRCRTPSSDGVDAVIENVARSVELLESRCGAAQVIGVGFAGLVNHRTGVVDSSVILPHWNGVELGGRLRQRLRRHVLVDNDATAAGWGEYRAMGSPTGLNLLVLTVGTGIGGAIVLDGRLYRGATNTSGEFGNMTIDWNGEDHESGNRGCLNTLASGTAIVKHAARLSASGGGLLMGRKDLALEDVAVAADRGDTAARGAIDIGARALGAGLANLLNAFNPDRVALMGGVLSLGDTFLDRVRVEARSRAMGPNAVHASIEPCRGGDFCGVVGVGALARELVSNLEIAL